MAANPINKFLNLIGLVEDDNDQDYDPRYVDVEDDEEYIPPTDNNNTRQSQNRESYERYKTDNYNPQGGFKRERSNASPINDRTRQNEKKIQPNRGADNVIHMKSEPSRHRTVIYYLRNFQDSSEIINDLLDGKTIVLNLEDMDDFTNQRVIDVLYGASYALEATLRKASPNTYLIAPKSVEVTDNDDSDIRSYTKKR